MMKTKILQTIQRRGPQSLMAIAVMMFLASCSMQTTSMQRVNTMQHEQAMVTKPANNNVAEVSVQSEKKSTPVADNSNLANTGAVPADKNVTQPENSNNKTVASTETKSHRFGRKFSEKTNLVRNHVTSTINQQLASSNLSITKNNVMSADKDSHTLIGHYLKIAIIFILIGLILEIFGYPFWIIGSIFVLIGVIFLVLWLLNEL